MAPLMRLSSVRMVLQYIMFFLVTICVIYTTNLLFISPLASMVQSFVSGPVSSTSARLNKAAPARGSGAIQPAFTLMPDNTWQTRRRSIFAWTSSDYTLRNGLGHKESIYIDENTVLSKAFSSSMHPSKVMPYFYRATSTPAADDITITTLITSNRFSVFERLVEKYRGPISVTVHIMDIPEHVRSVLDSLHDMYTSSPLMAAFVDVHLVVDKFDRQFNTWRNIARLFARTDFVMMLDIDFFPCTDFRTIIRRSSAISDKLYAGRAALVVPAFEYVNFHEGTDYAAFPTKKTDLLHLVERQRVDMFHAFWAPGHNASDYRRFYRAPPGEVYKVTRYQAAYEPYIIFRKDGPPWCDERFVGYGGNKAACLFEMYLAGVSLYVLADHFIIHQNHLYEEAARKNERKYNRKIYADYREETCLRYLKRYHAAGMLGSDVAENALSECKKIKSLIRTVPKLLQT